MTTYTRSSTQQWTLGSNDSTIFDPNFTTVFSNGASSTSINDATQGSTTTNGPPRPLGVPFRAALTKFRSRLTGQQLVEFKTATYEQLCQEIMRVQQDQENAKTMMNMSRIQSCLEAMHQFSKVIEVFLNVSDVVAFIWGPVKFLLLTASNWADSFEALLEAYEQIGEHLPLLQEYESLFGESPHMLQALELMYTDILEFHSEAMRFFTGRSTAVWRRFFKSVWKNFQTRFSGILKSLKRHKKLVECRADLYQYEKYEHDMEILKKQLNTLVEEEQTKKTKAVREWLATGSQAKIMHEKNLEARIDYPTTGTWIVKHEFIENWITADVPTTPLLWMTGMPGAGKTVLASVIIEECKLQKDFLTSYFYCSFDGSGSSSTVGIIRGLLEQLHDQFPLLMPHCHTKVATSGEAALRSLSVAKLLLGDFCAAIPRQFIIIDGLDECEVNDRKQLLDVFMTLLSSSEAENPGKLRVIFISQETTDIRRALQNSSNSRIVPRIISLNSTDNVGDIRMYVNDLANQVKARHGLDDDQTTYLRETTVLRADGMFLYAKLVMPNLLQQPTREQLLEEIRDSNFPEGLEEAYERIIKRIKITTNLRTWQMAKKLLGWMVCAKRQLTWKEIQVALSINTQNQSIDYEERSLRVHIQDICGSLVQISGDRVHLVHSTAKHYITKCTKDINEAVVECELAALCLQYLTFEVFHSDEDIEKNTLRQSTLQGHMAFQDYAIAKWSYHLNAFVDNGDKFFTSGAENLEKHLEEIAIALEDFTDLYHEDDWDIDHVPVCVKSCETFKGHSFHPHLLELTSHIYAFQKKGFEARHKVSLKLLSTALERNRKLLEELPPKLSQQDLVTYRQFYDDERRFKCPKITCMYFSTGFKDNKTRKKHVNIHDRPFQCEATECLATECGFANSKDLEKHKRAFHPEMSELAESFKQVSTTKVNDTKWSCDICGKSFTRKFHKLNHEKSHRGIREHACPECGRAFTRMNDMKRHMKLHDRHNQR